MLSPEEIAKRVVAKLEDMKAVEIRVLPVSTLTSMTDYMVVATGNSSRHVKAIAGAVVEDAKAAGLSVLGVEGESDAEWVLVDLSDLVLHVMQAQVREFYQLEKLWDLDQREVQPEVATGDAAVRRRGPSLKNREV